jgi:serine/threonine-protein kinase
VAGWNQLANTYLASGEFGLARAALARALEISPESATAQRNRCILALLTGDGGAHELCKNLPVQSYLRLFLTALAAFDHGDSAEAGRLLAELIAKNGEHNPAVIGAVYAWRGEKDSAFEWLERAYVQRWGLTDIKVSPFFRKIRDDPRFAALLKKMNLPQD